MSGVLGYALGYDAGRSDAEVSRQRREIVDEVFYGQRIVQVDQSYLDQLHQLVEKFRSNSIYNFDKGEQFHAKRLNGKRMRSAMRRVQRLSRPRLLHFKPNSPAGQRARSGAGDDCSGAGPPSNDPRRKVGPQPLPSDGDLADRGA